MRFTLFVGALCLNYQLGFASPQNIKVNEVDTQTEQEQNPQDGPPAPKFPYGMYQMEVFMKGMLGMTPVVTTDPNKLEDQAKQKLTPKAFGFLAGASGERATLDANRLAFRQWKIVPRVLRGSGSPKLNTKILGVEHPTPLLFAPVGFLNIFHPDAEPGIASIANEMNIPYVMSMSSSASMEDVGKANGDGDRWFQLYWPPSDTTTVSILKRAKTNGFRVLVVTLDTFALGYRPWDLDQGYMPTNINLANGTLPAMDGGFPSMTQTPSQPPSWERIKFLRENWSGPIVLKGIQHVEDAKLAVEAGVEGIIVSNHGGRQLDGGIGSLDVLPEIAEAVGDKITVLFDSGVRTGADVIKALSLGAKGVLIGRPWAYGLGIAGKDGAKQVIRGLLAQLEINMNIAGVRSVAQCSRNIMRKVIYPGFVDRD